MPPSSSPFALFRAGRPTLFAIILLIIIAVGLFWFARTSGYSAGYTQAQADIKNLQEQAAQTAAETAAQSANPFQAVNPLEGVEANPFEKVKKVLNPFES